MTGKNDGREQGRTIVFFMGKNFRRRNPSASGIRRTAGRDSAGIEDACGNWETTAFREENFQKMKFGIQGIATACGRAVCLCRKTK